MASVSARSVSSETRSVNSVVFDDAAIPAARHHLPPPLHGYVFVEHCHSALSHDTFLAHDTCQERLGTTQQEEQHRPTFVIRVYALDYLRRDEACRFALERAFLASRVAVHPHLLLPSDAFASRTDLFVVERFCSGGDLYELLVSLSNHSPDITGSAAAGERPLRKTFLPNHVTKRLMSELLSAVQYLHRSCGLVHRNIKLEELFLDEEQHLHLGGFGLCAALLSASEAATEEHEGQISSDTSATSPSTPLKLCCGSKHYAAPELLRVQPYQGEAVDAWACGVVLFALLTGCFPFDTEDGDEALHQLVCGDVVEAHLARHPSMIAIEDPQARDLISNLLRQNPRSRYTVSEALEHPYLQSMNNSRR